MKSFNFGTVSNLGTTQGPFYKKNKLRILDLSGAKMLKVNNFNMAFDSCYALNQLNLSNINAPLPIEHSNQMFSYNYQLTNLDLSSFDFSQLVSAGNMFTNVTATTVYVKTQADVDRLNEIVSDKPDTMTFVVKP
jgi:surface protein